MNSNIFSQIKNLKINRDPQWENVLLEEEFKHKLPFQTNNPAQALALVFYTIKTMRYHHHRKMLSIVYNSNTGILKIHNTKEFSPYMNTIDYDMQNIFNALLEQIKILEAKYMISVTDKVIYYEHKHETLDFILLYNDRNIFVIQKKTWPDLVYEKFISPIIIPKCIVDRQYAQMNLNFAELVAYKHFDDIYYSILQFVQQFNYRVNVNNDYFVYSSNCYVGQVVKHAHLHYKIPNISLEETQRALATQ